MADGYAHRLRRVFFDMHLPDWTRPGQSGRAEHELKDVATQFDVDEIVANFVRAQVNMAVFFAKCQYGNFYYNTTIGHKHSGLGSLDLLGEFVEKAHQSDIKVIAYYSNMWDVEVARQHPEWMALDAQGKTSYARWPRLCLNSPYRQLVHSHLSEMFTNYELDGVWMDILSELPCYCSTCQALFQERHGQPMPREKRGRAWIQLVRFQYDYLSHYIAQAREIVKGLRPEAAFLINFFGSPYALPSGGLSFDHLKLCDYGSTEGYTEWHGLQFPSYSARYMRAGMEGRPFEILTGRFVSTWDFTLRPLEQMKFEAFSVVANGGAACLDDEPYHTGRLEPLVYDHLAQVYQEIKAREEYLIGAVPLLYSAVYHSQKAREVDEILNPPLAEEFQKTTFFPKDNPAESDIVPSLMGAFKAIVEEHLPVQFITDRNLSLEKLRPFKVIYLPNVLPMYEEEAEVLRRYVAEGGGLVATYATSLYDEWGEQHEDFLLADLFGVNYLRKSPYTFLFFHFNEGPLAQGIPAMPLAHYKSLLEVQPNREVEVAATMVEPMIETTEELYYHNNKPAPYHYTDIPAIVCSRYGQGRVVYCSGQPEANYGIWGHAPYRRLMANALRWAAGEEPPIRPQAPLNTEVVFMQKGAQKIVHFLTCSAGKRVFFRNRFTRESIEESFPIHDIAVEIPADIQRARLLPGEEELPIQRERGRSWVVLPKIRLWETLVLE